MVTTSEVADPLQQAVETTAAELVAQRSKLDGLLEERDTLRSRLRELEATSGEDFLDDPAAADQIVEDTAKARVRLEVLDKALVAQEGRVAHAQSAYLTAEAEAIKPDVQSARDRLAKHRERVAELVAKLEQLEGEYVPRTELIDAWRSGGTDITGVRWRTPRSQQLGNAVTKAETRVATLLAMAAGDNPADVTRPISQADLWNEIPLADLYPPCVWRPGALVKAPVLVNRVAAAQHWVGALEDLAQSLPDELAQLKGTLPATPHTIGADPTAEARIVRLQERLDRLPAELKQAHRDLSDATSAVA